MYGNGAFPEACSFLHGLHLRELQHYYRRVVIIASLVIGYVRAGDKADIADTVFHDKPRFKPFLNADGVLVIFRPGMF